MKSVLGTGTTLVCGIVLVILKFVGVINWNWLWVLSPFWIPVVIYSAVLAWNSKG